MKLKTTRNPMVAGTEVLRRAPAGDVASVDDLLAREEPLEIRVRGRSVAVTMRTPGHDQELVAGFLLTEQVISTAAHLGEIAPCRGSSQPENILNVMLADNADVDFQRLSRHVFATSSCGVCGKASIQAIHQQFAPINSSLRIALRSLLQLPARMSREQHAFAETGGLHAAAIFDSSGKCIVLREDVGRHNAVDKVIGYGLLNKAFPFDSHILLVSGRASFEIIQKALAARVPIVCAVSAPSSLAVEFAQENKQTLVGFLRNDGLNIYSGAERIIT